MRSSATLFFLLAHTSVAFGQYGLPLRDAQCNDPKLGLCTITAYFNHGGLSDVDYAGGDKTYHTGLGQTYYHDATDFVPGSPGPHDVIAAADGIDRN